MGNDWGGRKKLNPENAPRVSAKQVRHLASSIGVDVRRDGCGGAWWFYDGQWLTLGQTNYLAMVRLQEMVAPNKHLQPTRRPGHQDR